MRCFVWPKSLALLFVSVLSMLCFSPQIAWAGSSSLGGGTITHMIGATAYLMQAVANAGDTDAGQETAPAAAGENGIKVSGTMCGGGGVDGILEILADSPDGAVSPDDPLLTGESLEEVRRRLGYENGQAPIVKFCFDPGSPDNLGESPRPRVRSAILHDGGKIRKSGAVPGNKTDRTAEPGAVMTDAS